jgi:hypothetical protein
VTSIFSKLVDTSLSSSRDGCLVSMSWWVAAAPSSPSPSRHQLLCAATIAFPVHHRSTAAVPAFLHRSIAVELSRRSPPPRARSEPPCLLHAPMATYTVSSFTPNRLAESRATTASLARAPPTSIVIAASSDLDGAVGPSEHRSLHRNRATSCRRPEPLPMASTCLITVGGFHLLSDLPLIRG